jgi:hypothetical protein
MLKDRHSEKSVKKPEPLWRSNNGQRGEITVGEGLGLEALDRGGLLRWPMEVDIAGCVSVAAAATG